MGDIRVFIRLEVDPPGSINGNETVAVSQHIEHGISDRRLIVQAAEEAIKITAQKVMAMVNAAHPDRRGEIKETVK